MTATMLQPVDIARANALAIEIGARFRRERQRHGDRLVDVATRLGLSPRSMNTIVQFEQGAVTDTGLGTIIRNLGLYGYTLAVVPITPLPPREL